MKSGSKKRSHATIKNPNQVYGNNHHVKGSIKNEKIIQKLLRFMLMVIGQNNQPDSNYHNAWVFKSFLEIIKNLQNHHANLPYYNYQKTHAKKRLYDKKKLRND